jgi:serine/threonine protein phosphatase PrpC
MGSYLPAPKKEKFYAEAKTADDTIRVTAAAMQGWRLQMEDAHLSIVNLEGKADLHLFAVFDGHGGKEVAKYAEKHFVEHLLASPDYQTGKYPEGLTEAFMKLDESMKTEAGKRELKLLKADDPDDEYGGGMLETVAGCTANVVLIAGEDIFTANAGDSRAVLFRNGKSAIELSCDHKTHVPEEVTRVQKAGGDIVEGRINGLLNLTRSFGDFDFKKNTTLPLDKQMITPIPDVTREKLTPTDDFLIIACDGIWETLTSQEVCDKMEEKLKRHGRHNQKMVLDEFFNELLAVNPSQGVGCDNMTLILIVFKPKQALSPP